MKKDKLSEVERQFIEAIAITEGLSVSNMKAEAGIVRDMVRRTAYHEAGHVAGRVFAGNGCGNIIHIAIIPDKINNGRVRMRQDLSEAYLESYPPPLMRTAGRCLLLELLAGRGAAARIAAPEDREDILDDDALWLEGEQEGTDLFRALRVAEIMARPGMPARRVLALAEKWTVEMLALPDVWECVETLAGVLLERGTIEDPAEIMAACEPILDMGLTLPKWRRRLTVTKAEQTATLAQLPTTSSLLTVKGRKGIGA
jgi:hypothetical protein